MQLLDRLLPLDDSWLWFAIDVGLKATLLLAIAAAMTFVLRADRPRCGIAFGQ